MNRKRNTGHTGSMNQKDKKIKKLWGELVAVPFWCPVSPNGNIRMGKVHKHSLARSIRLVSRKTQFDFWLPLFYMQNFELSYKNNLYLKSHRNILSMCFYFPMY